MPTVRCYFVTLVLAAGLAAQSGDGPPPPKFFMGRPITVSEPKIPGDGHFAQGPVSICLEGPPRRQCYTFPSSYVRYPTVEVIQIDTTTSALLVSAASQSAAGWDIHFALVRPGPQSDLEDLFPSSPSVSNVSQHRFLKLPEVSAAPIFLTADSIWGIDESRWGEHRIVVSAYVNRYSPLSERSYFSLEDRYMTTRKYDLERGGDIIASEKQEILARLKRVLADRSK